MVDGNIPTARGNLYDEANTDMVTNGGAASSGVPTYETIPVHRNGITEKGPAVLNPVYGSASASANPISSPGPTSKEAPNPIYSESTPSMNLKCDHANMQQLPDVDGINPIYADLGPGTRSQRLPSDPSGPRYANNPASGPQHITAHHSAQDPSATANTQNSALIFSAPPMYAEINSAEINSAEINSAVPPPKSPEN